MVGAQAERIGETAFRGNRARAAFLLGGKPFRWLNRGMKPEVFTPTTLPPVSPGRKRYGVLGFPVAHSLSPEMQLAGFRALDISAEYFRVEVPPTELAGALPLLRQAGFQGWNCTLPHKETMFNLCTETDASAQESGSVNTVMVSGSGLHGFSTDADGWQDAVAEAWKLDLPTQRILILGCGGVGRTLAIRLAKKGCRTLILSNRNQAKAHGLAEELRRISQTTVSTVPWASPELAEAVQKSDLLIHATPLGLASTDLLPIPENCLHAGVRVYDTVYRKDYTPLVRTSRQHGCEALDGLGMLLHQGARALQIWSGQAAPRHEMRSALEKAAGRSL